MGWVRSDVRGCEIVCCLASVGFEEVEAWCVVYGSVTPSLEVYRTSTPSFLPEKDCHGVANPLLPFS